METHHLLPNQRPPMKTDILFRHARRAVQLRFRRFNTGLTILALVVSACFSSEHVLADAEQVFRRSVVAADHPAASQAGAEILRRGGNVVDAAVATSFALSVVRPASCGIGGGGFMMIWNAETGKATALDYRERAPLAATRDLYLKSDSDVQAESGSVRGPLAVGIPGTVAGLCHAAEHYGSLPLSTLLEPAIRLCRDGVLIDEHDIEVQRAALNTIGRHSGYETRFALLYQLYLNNGVPWKKGDRFFSPQLPALQLIAEHGADGFYRGKTAASILQLMQSRGGIITAADLERRIPVERDALSGLFQGDRILAMPPPSSGGIALLQTLHILESREQLTGRKLKTLKHNSPEYVHVVTEAMKHAFADRAEFLGDSDFVDVPVDRLLSREYAQAAAAKIDPAKTLAAEQYGRFFAKEDSGTSHFSVIDAAGNAVACTETINLTFGSFVVVPEYGILLNNQMDDFAARPGEPNAFGLMQSEANAVQPGKKPLSSMTPTIVVRNGRAVFACGASGGPRIITASLQTLLNRELFGMPPRQAVAAPRFHHQWFPNELLLEKPLAATVSSPLEQLGHQVKTVSSLAAAQAVGQSSEGLQAGSDPRKHGEPSGE